MFESNKNIAVIGDSIIDEYYYVNAEKVSPEFPIPILQSESSCPDKILPGGAANVCYQFLNFRNNIYYFSLVDRDVLNVLDDFDFINNDGCCLLPYFSSAPKKKRFYQDSFPLCRLDVETKNYSLSEDQIANLQNKIFNNLLCSKNLDVAIFSDYSKGLFYNYNAQDCFKSLGKNVIKIVDPKKGPVSKWKGCDIIKPNYKEALELSGETDWKKQVDYFKTNTGCDSVIITKSGDGVVGIIGEEYFELIPQNKTSAVSVIGAGDCFVSLLAICISSKISIRKSIEIAFEASSLFVKNKNNNPIHPLDLIHDKFIDSNLLINRNFSLCFTNGCFDILHPGHIQVLKFAKSKADKLVVAINSDKSVLMQDKSHPLINNFDYRRKMIESLEFVDYVVEFDEKTPIEIIKNIRPDVLVKGDQYENPVGSEFVNKVELCPILENFSTSKIIEKIKNLET